MIKTIVSICWARGLLQQFQKEPSITFRSENCKQKGVSFFGVISTSSTNSCLFLQKRADIFFPKLFRPKIEVCFRVLWSLRSSWQPRMRTFDVITRWRSNVHPLISRIMTSTLYSTSLINVRYFCSIMHFLSIFIVLWLRISCEFLYPTVCNIHVHLKLFK